MSLREIPLDQVPGINIVRANLRSLDHAISLVAAGYDFDKNEYVLKLTLGTRKARVAFPWNLLHDIRQDTGKMGQQYTRELYQEVAVVLKEAATKLKSPPV